MKLASFIAFVFLQAAVLCSSEELLLPSTTLCGHCSDHNQSKLFAFKKIGGEIVLNMTMTIPQLSGTVPAGGNVNVIPFAIAPDGKILRGNPTNIVPANALVQALQPVNIRHPLRGNYVVGYFVTLGSGSPVFPPNVIGNFSGVILNNAVGTQFQTITFPVQTLFFASLASEQDVLTITADFPVDSHLVK